MCMRDEVPEHLVDDAGRPRLAAHRLTPHH